MASDERISRTVPAAHLAALAGGGAFFLSVFANHLSRSSLILACCCGIMATMGLVWDLWKPSRHRDSDESAPAPNSESGPVPTQAPSRAGIRTSSITANAAARSATSLSSPEQSYKNTSIALVCFAAVLVWMVPVVQVLTFRGDTVDRPSQVINNVNVRPDGMALVPSDGKSKPNDVVAPVQTDGVAQAQAGLLEYVALVGLMVGLVIVLWAWKQDKLGTKAAAATGLALTLGTVSLVKELKLDFAPKLDIEKLVGITIKKELPNGSFAQRIGPFPSGEVAIDANLMAKELAGFNKKLPASGEQLLAGLILVIGSADRRPLSRSLQAKFGSNMGLARARAEWVKDQVAEEYKSKGVPSPEIQILVLAPQHTGRAATEQDMQEDRSVYLRAVGIAAKP